MKRLTFFSFFDPNKQIDSYVIHYLKELSEVSDIIFSTDCNISEKELSKIKNLVLFSLINQHGEYDFGSHKRAYIEASNRNLLNNYDWLILANDSCYGPFYKFKPILLKMESKELDYWGFTHNTVDLTPHIQSYFVAIKSNAFLSQTFNDFILSIKQESIRRNIILNYEHGLTKKLKNAGFKYDTFFTEEPLSFLHDPVKDWDKMIEKGFPFIKRTLFTRNTYRLKNLKTYKNIIHQNFPEYDLKLIEENLDRYSTLISRFDIVRHRINKKFKKC